MAPRYYAPELSAGSFGLPAEELHHLRGVRRMAQGQEVEVFDGRGGLARCRIARLERRDVLLEPLEIWQEQAPAARLVLATAIAKGDRMLTLLEKVTELGVWAVRPLLTERGVVTAEGQSRRASWRQRTIEAAKQCGRAFLPEISEPAPLEALLAQWQQSAPGRQLRQMVLLDPNPAAMPLPALLQEMRDAAGTETSAEEMELTALVGPEGGFTAEEMTAALAVGARAVRLAPHILRIETAADRKSVV